MVQEYGSWDEYQEEQSKTINPDKFYTSYASDERGEVINYREDPKLVRQMRQLIASGTIPAYETMADVIRDAVRHRLFYLTNDWEMPDSVKKELRVQQLQTQWDNWSDYLDNMGKISKTAEENLEKAFQERDAPALRKMLEMAEDTLIRLEDPYYRKLADVIRQYEIKLDSMWGRPGEL